jgi:hypothetical protein
MRPLRASAFADAVQSMVAVIAIPQHWRRSTAAMC